MRKWRVQRPGRPGIPHQNSKGGLGRGRFREGRTDTSPTLPVLQILGNRIGSEGGVAIFSIPSFFFLLRKQERVFHKRSNGFLPLGRQRSRPLPEMPHAQVAGRESHEDEVPPSPLSGREVCGSVREAVQSESSNAAETRGLWGGGAPDCLRLHGNGLWRARGPEEWS